MASPSRREGVNLIALLLSQPYRFDFFQAVRLLERIVRSWAKNSSSQPCRSIGYDNLPEQEAIRFRHMPSLAFPPSPIEVVRSCKDPAPVEMLVSFLGLVGSSGVLPHHYTALLLRQLRDNDKSLLHFLDLFEHRLVSHFYRSWEKYRLPFSFERFRTEPGNEGDDPITTGIYSFVGMGMSKLRHRRTVPDAVFLYYAGHFAHHPRCAVSLEELLRDYFELPIALHQLQGQWLALPEKDVSRVTGNGRGGGNNAIGKSFVVGKRVWEVQSKFRLRIGPVGYAAFSRLMPCGDILQPMHQLTRSYVGPELDFDVQPILKAKEVPLCRLRSVGERSRLGWNTWVHSKPMPHDVDDAVFSLKDL